MFDNIMNFFKKANKREAIAASSKETAKERLQLVLMQDRANVSVDFLDLMRHEIIEVIKKYIDIDEESMDVRLTNAENEDGTQGAPALYANIPIINIKEKAKKMTEKNKTEEEKKEDKKEETEQPKTENNEGDIKKVEEKDEQVQEKSDKTEETEIVKEEQKENNPEKESENE